MQKGWKLGVEIKRFIFACLSDAGQTSTVVEVQTIRKVQTLMVT